MTAPAVTVLMPVYNGEAHLCEAVDSILAQTFTDFELIVVDDGSSDATPKILEDYARKDTRVRIVHNEQNVKIAASLNKGLMLARAPLIARMDADDVSLPERLAEQVRFMTVREAITLCGSFMRIYDTNELWSLPEENDYIRARLLFWNSFYHPTVVFRKEEVLRLTDGYAEEASGYCEDYDLWIRLAEHSEVRFANIPQALVRYRQGHKVLSPQHGFRWRNCQKNIYARQLQRMGVTVIPKIMQSHWNAIFGKIFFQWQLDAIDTWLLRILYTNSLEKKIDSEALVREVLYRHLLAQERFSEHKTLPLPQRMRSFGLSGVSTIMARLRNSLSSLSTGHF